jgi:hypothetical protein
LSAVCPLWSGNLKFGRECRYDHLLPLVLN